MPTKTKKKEEPLKISPYDRIQALRTIPQFIEDLNEIHSTKGFTVDKEKAFERKYGVAPQYVDLCAKSLTKEDIEFWESSAENFLKNPSAFFDPPTVQIMPFKERTVLSTETQSGISMIEIDYEGEPFIEDGRFAKLKIDLMKSTSEILEHVKERVDLLRERVPDRAQGKRPLSLEKDMWKIYKMHKDENMTFSDITRSLFPKLKYTRSAAHSPELKTSRKAVQAAYDKAHAIVEQVEQDLTSSTRKDKQTQ